MNFLSPQLPPESPFHIDLLCTYRGSVGRKEGGSVGGVGGRGGEGEEKGGSVGVGMRGGG